MIIADTCWATELSSFLLFLRKTMTAGSTSRNIGEEKICQVIGSTRCTGSTNDRIDYQTTPSLGAWWRTVKAPSSAGRRGSELLFGTSTGCVTFIFWNMYWVCDMLMLTFEVGTEFVPFLCLCFGCLHSRPSTLDWFIEIFVWNLKHRKNCECCPGHYLSTSVY